MNIVDSIQDAFSKVKDKVLAVIGKRADSDNYEFEVGTIPPKGNEKVAPHVEELLEEARQYYIDRFSKTSEYRTKLKGMVDYATDPEVYTQDCLKLVSGNHYAVWGRRKTEQDDWMAEVVDPEIQSQIRNKSQQITANWHDVTITPNIDYVSDICDNERKKTDWGTSRREDVVYAQSFGHVDVISTLDKKKDPRGIATEIRCEPNTFFLSPYAMSTWDAWYMVWETSENQDWVKSNTNIDLKEINPTAKPYLLIPNMETGDAYTHTKHYRVTHLWMDDKTEVRLPMSEWEYNPDESADEILRILSGEEVHARREQNHPRHLAVLLQEYEKQIAIAEEVKADGKWDEMGESLFEDMIMRLQGLINEHEEQANDPTNIRTTPKYPTGRYIILVEDKVAYDEPNPDEFDWRYLHHRLYNEKAVNRLDGRSVPEILCHTNKEMDLNLSRFADSIYLSRGKILYDEQSRKIHEGNPPTVDPVVPEYYRGQPPIYIQRLVNDRALDIYNRLKQNIIERLGDTNVMRGQEPFTGASGKLVETLVQQGQILVTGELNSNLNDFVESILRTRMKMWKQYYIEDRTWVINGEQVTLNLSDRLRWQEIDGQRIPQEEFEISVRPYSNFPNKWENDMQLLVQLMGEETLRQPDGRSMIPMELVVQLLASRFPQLNEDKYKVINQAAEIGLQVMQQEQEKQEEEAKDIQSAKKAFKNKALRQLINAPLFEEENAGN